MPIRSHRWPCENPNCRAPDPHGTSNRWSNINEHRQVFGVEPICGSLINHGLKIEASTYYAAKNRTPSARSVRDAELKAQISRVHTDGFSVYGMRKV
jgi:hypothetical protein